MSGPGRSDRPQSGSVGAALLALAAGALLAASATAQPVLEGRQHLKFDRPESWGMQFASAVTELDAVDAPRPIERGALEIGVELGSVPRLSESERRLGFDGTKTEAIDRSAIVARIRLAVGLGRGLVLDLGAVPPVEVDGIEPGLYGLALRRQLFERDRWHIGGLIGLQVGTLVGDITCSAGEAAAGTDPIRNPLLCEEASRDRVELRTFTAGASVAYRPRRPGGLEPFLAASIHRLDGEFQVRARYNGLVDRTRLDTDGVYWTALLGAGMGLGSSTRLSGVLAYSPLQIRRPGRSSTVESATTIRVAILRRIR